MRVNDAIQRFPSVELSYDKLLHKKVRARCFSLLPQGVRSLLWFTYIEDRHVPLLLTLDRRGNISNATPTTLSFSDELVIGEGTVLNGIIFEHNSVKCFTCLEPLIYKGQPVWREKISVKMDILGHIVNNEMNVTPYCKDWLLVGLPYTTTSFNDAVSVARTLPYSVHGIRLFDRSKTRTLGYVKYTGSQVSTANFTVKAQIQADVYSLYTQDHIRGNRPRIALVQDYKSSVMMNKLFRQIKENDNLDLLEESDDEEEFEDISDDKYVDTKKTYVMECVYEPRFKKWRPIKLTPKGTVVTLTSEVEAVERKNVR